MNQTLNHNGQAAVGGMRELISFRIGAQEFCVDIMAIREIRGWTAATALPQSPSFVRGVINLRGAVVPVVDLASRFGGKPSQITRRSCIVILELESEAGDQVIGVVVDAVNEVLEIAAADIEPPPSFGTRIRTDFIHGMGKVQERFVIILNVNNVLSTEDLAILGEAAADGQETAP